MNEYSTPAFDKEISLHEIIGGVQALTATTKKLNPRTQRTIKRPVFVVGSPRSGTTVLGKCLGAHSTCATAEESLILLPLWRMYADLFAGNLPSGVKHLLEYTTEDKLITTLGMVSDELFSGLLKRTGAQTYIDHTPWYGMIAPFIHALYPDAQFIHIIRDGRQVVRSLSDSYKKGFLWAGHDHVTRCKIWVNIVRVTRDGLDQQGCNAIELHYKDLCFSPKQTLESATQFLQLQFQEKMLEPLTQHHAPSTITTTYGLDRLTEMFSPDGWPIDWDAEMCNIFLSEAGELMEDLFGPKWTESPQ